MVLFRKGEAMFAYVYILQYLIPLAKSAYLKNMNTKVRSVLRIMEAQERPGLFCSPLYCRVSRVLGLRWTYYKYLLNE